MLVQTLYSLFSFALRSTGLSDAGFDIAFVTVLLIGSGAVAVGITAVLITKTIVTGAVPYHTAAANKANAPMEDPGVVECAANDAILNRAKKLVI